MALRTCLWLILLAQIDDDLNEQLRAAGLPPLGDKVRGHDCGAGIVWPALPVRPDCRVIGATRPLCARFLSVRLLTWCIRCCL
jgi:hypothetical protein